MPLVIDINDSISIFNNWNKKRLSFYKSKKFIVKSTELEEEVKELCSVNDTYLLRDI